MGVWNTEASGNNNAKAVARLIFLAQTTHMFSFCLTSNSGLCTPCKDEDYLFSCKCFVLLMDGLAKMLIQGKAKWNIQGPLLWQTSASSDQMTTGTNQIFHSDIQKA